MRKNETKLKKPNLISKERRLRRYYYFATYILALIAGLGFVWSIYSSRQTSITLEKLNKGLSSFTEPILIFDDFNWFKKTKELNCDNPPIGINVIYRNASNIPIKCKNSIIKTFYGDYEILPDHENNLDKEYTVIPAGGTLGFTQLFIIQELQNKMKNKISQYEPPFFKIKLNITISTIDESKAYELNLINQIGIDCDSYSIKNMTEMQSSYTPLILTKNKDSKRNKK